MAVAWLFRPFLLWTSLLVLLPLTFSVSDSEALLKLKKSFTNASALDSWVPGSAPCNEEGTWNGLLCHKGIVTGLRLEGMGLSGNIDVDALVWIKGLRSFSVINNSFTGTIPEINRLGALKALFLSRNQFSGEIPTEYFAKMESLKKVWLSHNKFTGNIPYSLGQLPHLIDVHLENNQFSGHIPAFNSPSLKSVNLSNNELVGEIPSSLSKFNPNSFAGNPGLCGEQVGVDCSKAIDRSPEPMPSPENTAPVVQDHGRKNDSKKIIAAIITLGVMLLSVILFFAIRWRKKKKGDSDVLGRGSPDGAVSVQVSVAARREMEESRKNASSSSRGSNHAKGSAGVIAELVMVNDEKGVFGLPDLMKAAAEVLGVGGLGSSYKAVMANGVAVVAKRMREMNALGKDAFDADVRKLGKLRHPNILTPLAYHYRTDEKLFVYEYLPKGSLLYLLHGDHGTSCPELDWPARLKIVQGIAQGLDYLHTELASLDVPHGNLKSSNVLLGPDNHPFLSDYGFWPLVNTNGAQTLFAYKTPEALQHGMVSPKSDVYCLGIIILEILTGKFPSQYLRDGKGGTDVVQWVTSAFSEGRQAELLDPEIACCQNSLASMEKLLHIGLLCTQSSSDQRLEMKEAIRMIAEIEVEGGIEFHSQARTIEVLPSLRDGIPDAATSNSSSFLEGKGEHATTRHGP
ncbi:pollen receptor-like kinase 3 [Herrania umbratica]|uniref:Pollen receptor-like kinase 3 n=1 Tax=Herrania umbratica TaxID=108875 RepID=A0A6J1B5J3_9ROSI|nr:pollen receptor-like kinase 3 [Herrania umbratica]